MGARVFLYLFLSALIFWIPSFPVLVYAENQPAVSATYTLHENNSGNAIGSITVRNHSSEPLKNWSLVFNFTRRILKLTGGRMVEQVGDYYRVTQDENGLPIPAGGSIVLSLRSRGEINHVSDTPSGYFIVSQGAFGELITPVERKVSLPQLTSKQASKFAKEEYERNLAKKATQIEDRDSLPDASSHLGLIPIPVALQVKQGVFALTQDTVIQTNTDGVEYESALFLAEVLRSKTGFPLRIVAYQGSVGSVQPSIRFTIQGAKSLGLEGEAEGYELEVSPAAIVVRASTATGLFYGAQSIRQLFSSYKGTIPCLSAIDYPRFAYRGLELDVARNFRTVDEIKRLLDLMALHKLNVFHWHLTDDEGWRIEIKRYPELTQIGAWRGYGKVLPPHYGSGPEINGGYYTQEQIRDVVSYAAKRHIAVIPEVDLPAHARALTKSLPHLVTDLEDRSVYSSGQNFHDNVISPCIETTYQVLDDIIKEVSELFPSPSIHTGGDELPANVWSDSPACRTYLFRHSIAAPESERSTTEQLAHHFTQRLQDIVRSKGKVMAGWEELARERNLSGDSLFYAWTGVDAGSRIAEKGYNVILTPGPFLYFDLAYSSDPWEPGQYWGGYVDTFKSYSYSPIPLSMPAEIASKMKGVQGALWTEQMPTQEVVDYQTFPKMASLAEVGWSPESRKNWLSFAERIGNYYLPMLEELGVNYRLSPPGAMVMNSMLNANVEFPELEIRYTFDGTTPTSVSPLYIGPVKVVGSRVKLRSFSKGGRASRMVEISE